MSSIAYMKSHIIPGGFDPIDFIRRNDDDALPSPHRKSCFILGSDFLSIGFFQKLPNPSLKVGQTMILNPSTRVLYRTLKARVVYGLQQVINSMHFKRI